MLDLLAAHLRYTAGLAHFLRLTLELEAAREVIRVAVKKREASFLDILERGVIANAASPYRRLFRNANLELDDVPRLVGAHGLEGALGRLYDAGVYLTSAELKGRRPIRRPGLEYHAKPSDFDNPLVGSHYAAASSGSRGQASRVVMDFDLIRHEAAYIASVLASHELDERPIAVWRSALSDGLKTSLRYALLRRTPERWFSQRRPSLAPSGIRESAFLASTLATSRVLGRPLPGRTYAPGNDVLTVARWLAEMTARGSPALLETNPSPAVRVCLAAREQGLDISGSVFHIVGEPYTPAKARVIESVGARAINRYAMAELGVVGLGCANAGEPGDVHLASDKVAMIQCEKRVDASGTTVQALVFTSLLAGSPKLMLNVETDDYADVSTQDCGCELQRLGLTTHLSSIRSYEKLTSEGVTFIGSDLYRLLEEVLPARFGGGPTDYQLVEDEQDGAQRVGIVVAPSVGAVEDAAVVATVLDTLRRVEHGRLMANAWDEARTLRVVRHEPYATGTAKILPLHVLRRGAPAGVD